MFVLSCRNDVPVETLRKMTLLLNYAALGETNPALVKENFYEQLQKIPTSTSVAYFVFLSPNKRGISVEVQKTLDACDTSVAASAHAILHQHFTFISLNRLPHRFDKEFKLNKQGQCVGSAKEKLDFTTFQQNAHSYVLEGNMRVFDAALIAKGL